MAAGTSVGGHAVADRARHRLVAADGAADAEVVGVDERAVDLQLLALDADVGDPVLAAGVGAAGHVDPHVAIEARQPRLEVARRAGARSPWSRSARACRTRCRCRPPCRAGRARRRAESPGPPTSRGQPADARARGTSSTSRFCIVVVRSCAGAVSARPASATARICAGVSRPRTTGSRRSRGRPAAGDERRRGRDRRRRAASSGTPGASAAAETPLQLGQEARRRPAAVEEEELQPRLLAVLAQHVAVAEDLGDRRARPARTSRQRTKASSRTRQVRVGREPAADPHGEADLARHGMAHGGQPDVVDLGIDAPAAAAGDRDLVLARQVVEVRVAIEQARGLVHERRGVDQLVGVDARPPGSRSRCG